MTRQRRPKAMQVRGGRWVRPPRPRPKPKSPETDAEHELAGESDEGYESCDEGASEMLHESLVMAMQPVMELLLRLGETEAASSVQTLCDYVNASETDYARQQRAHAKCRIKLSDACRQIVGKENLKGQTVRYWKRIQVLQSKLFLERMKARSRRQWFPP